MSGDLFTDLNEASINILITDANVALTFTQIAATRKDAETVERNIQNALTAYRDISAKRLKFVFATEQAERLQGKLDLVKKRLHALGHDVD